MMRCRPEGVYQKPGSSGIGDIRYFSPGWIIEVLFARLDPDVIKITRS